MADSGLSVEVKPLLDSRPPFIQMDEGLAVVEIFDGAERLRFDFRRGCAQQRSGQEFD